MTTNTSPGTANARVLADLAALDIDAILAAQAAERAPSEGSIDEALARPVPDLYRRKGA